MEILFQKRVTCRFVKEKRFKCALFGSLFSVKT